MLKGSLKLIVILLAVLGFAVVVFGVWFASGGIAARPAPGRVETAVARSLRSMAIPRASKNLSNPLPANEGVVREGMEHFADHCAVCHGNNGSGDTLFGRGMYPRPPDLRREPTQEMTDGELFYIIENGVKLTGMPAFGDGSAESANGSWGLVHFIRHLPQITEQEIKAMEALNPRPPGDASGTSPATAKPHTHKHKH